MAEVKRITIPVDSELKDRLELIAKNQKRSLSANLEHALEVYAALFDEQGKMLVPIDSILMGDLSSLRNSNTSTPAPVKEVEEVKEVKSTSKETSQLQELAEVGQDVEIEFEC